MVFSFRKITRGAFTLLLVCALFASIGCGPQKPPGSSGPGSGPGGGGPGKTENPGDPGDEEVLLPRFGMNSEGEALLCNGGIAGGLQVGYRCGVCKTIEDQQGNKRTLCEYDAASTVDYECANVEADDTYEDGTVKTQFPGVCRRRIKKCSEQWQVCGQKYDEQEFDKTEYKATDKMISSDPSQGIGWVGPKEYIEGTNFACVASSNDKPGLCQHAFNAGFSSVVDCPTGYTQILVRSNGFLPITYDSTETDAYEKLLWKKECEKKLKMEDCQVPASSDLEYTFTAASQLSSLLYGLCVKNGCDSNTFSANCRPGEVCKAKLTADVLMGIDININSCQPALGAGTKKIGDECTETSDCADYSTKNIACVRGQCMQWCNFKSGAAHRACDAGSTCSEELVSKAVGRPTDQASLCLKPDDLCELNEKGKVTKPTSMPSGKTCLPITEKRGLVLKEKKSGRKALEECADTSECAHGYQCVTYSFDTSTDPVKAKKYCMRSCPANSSAGDTWCRTSLGINDTVVKTSTLNTSYFSCLSTERTEIDPQLNSPLAVETGVCQLGCSAEALKNAESVDVTIGSGTPTKFTCQMTQYGGFSYQPVVNSSPSKQAYDDCVDDPYACPSGTICTIDANEEGPKCYPLCSMDAGQKVSCELNPKTKEQPECYTARIMRNIILRKYAPTTPVQRKFKKKAKAIWTNTKLGVCSPELKR